MLTQANLMVHHPRSQNEPRETKPKSQQVNESKMNNLPPLMKAIVPDGTGSSDVLKIKETELPIPGANEVLIKVAAAGVNRPDVLQRMGRYPPPPGASDILGLEVSGDVVAIGGDVGTVAVGDQVCALLASGGYAEYCVAPALQCLPVPKGISLIEAAALPENFFTVWSNLTDRAHLKKGETLLIHGGSSGIGLTALQLAKALGVTPYVTVGNDEKAAFCEKLGAKTAINYREESFDDVIAEETSGRGVDVILDMIGGDYTQRNISSLADDGRLVQISYLNGSRIEAEFRELMTRRLTWTGSTLRSRSVEYKHAIATALHKTVWPMIEDGRIKPVIDSTFALEDVALAHDKMETSAHIGKILLTT